MLILKAIQCYCAECIRSLLILIFCISQGSVVPHAKDGGKYNKCCKFPAESSSERVVACFLTCIIWTRKIK